MLTYAFRIRGQNPETLPIKRLGEYLVALSTLLGQETPLRFERIVKGSAKLKFRASETDATIVEYQARFAAQDEGARKHYLKLDDMLREDKASAEFRQEKKGALPLLELPGIAANATLFPIVRDTCEFHGRIIRVGGRDDTIPVGLQTPSGDVIACTASLEMAKKLKAWLLEPIDVLLSGLGKWTRDADGKWSIVEFRVDAAEPMNTEGFEEALRAVQKSGSGWDVEADPETAWLALRQTT
ncbi:MAG: hypothetical protein LBS49_12535 [Candidatus Accumulibacter sp.]|jgi:hypothetical protein|nr:hypothetical protein [Accumulibacter sp.]